MILHNLKVAVRNLMKYKLQTAISVLSIAVGILTISLAHSYLSNVKLCFYLFSYHFGKHDCDSADTPHYLPANQRSTRDRHLKNHFKRVMYRLTIKDQNRLKSGVQHNNNSTS
ncbi:MAG: hypothetical protein K2G85_11125 [Muribaculaceae bacterium]|nr:hypothetical protein [Muribaculaceae bacterium]